MREFIHRPARPLESVTLGGVKKQALIRGLDAAARKASRRRADMLGIIVEDWLAAWEASGGEARVCQPGYSHRGGNPLLGRRVPLTGDELEALRASPKPADEGGVVIPFRPRQEEPEK